MTRPEISIASSYEMFCEQVTQEILAFSNKKIAARGQFTVVLSGGVTPKGVYECMAGPSYREKFQWNKIHFFWSDERWVPPEDQKSNYRMVSETLLSKVRIPSGNIHPIQTRDYEPESSARLYEAAISGFFKLKKGEFPHFDLILLGLGWDGHIASLFPNNPALLTNDRLVSAVSQEGIKEERITLTLPVINHAEMIFFLVSGHDKADIVRDTLEDQNRNFLPAKKVKPYQGKIRWFLDRAAASNLSDVTSLTKGKILS